MRSTSGSKIVSSQKKGGTSHFNKMKGDVGTAGQQKCWKQESNPVSIYIHTFLACIIIFQDILFNFPSLVANLESNPRQSNLHRTGICQDFYILHSHTLDYRLL